MKTFTFTFCAGVPDVIEVEAETEEEAFQLFHDELDGNVNVTAGEAETEEFKPDEGVCER